MKRVKRASLMDGDLVQAKITVTISGVLRRGTDGRLYIIQDDMAVPLDDANSGTIFYMGHETLPANAEDMLQELVAQGHMKTTPDGKFSLTEQGKVYAQQILETSPDAQEMIRRMEENATSSDSDILQ